uniref:DNA repair and recombination protein RAD54-like n=1 Tax=Strongyloides venezuelensis TaxID=75913 RepID=A0A0K0FD76_STRVS
MDEFVFLHWDSLIGKKEDYRKLFLFSFFGGINAGDSEIGLVFLSLKAGGVGLNLIRGNHTLILELDWNLFNENQSYDRTYRIG